MKNWLFLAKDKVTFFFLYRFVDDTDATIANLVFNELIDAKREVNNAPGFSVHDPNKLPTVFN